jgi:hypothetical protein
VKACLVECEHAQPAIRVLKKWVKSKVWETGHVPAAGAGVSGPAASKTLKKPTSYLLELVVFQVCRALASAGSTTVTLLSVLTVSFEVLLALATMSPQSRSVRDLACPTNNVARGVQEPVWALLAAYCRVELAVLRL